MLCEEARMLEALLTKPDDLSNLIGDLQRQRRELDHELDETARSRRSTAEIVERIISLKQRAQDLEQRKSGQ